VRRFADLFADLDRSQKTLDKLAALERYFRETPAEDAAWALHFLAGGKLRRLANSTELRTWAAREAGLPDWMIDECYEAVGDLAETIALLLPDPAEVSDETLHHWVEQTLVPWTGAGPEERRAAILRTWRSLPREQRLVANKLLTGAFRVGVSRTSVLKGLSRVAGIDSDVLQHRFAGDWRPTAENFRALVDAATPPGDGHGGSRAVPYPFFLAHALDVDPESLGAIDEWQAEWKWDGIRAQVMKRGAEVLVWTRGEELASGRFPEIEARAARWPDGTVVDGEILAWDEAAGSPMPFQALQRRIQRKTVGAKLLREVPVALVAYDLLEEAGVDLRARPLTERRARLEALLADSPSLVSPVIVAEDWSKLAALRHESRERRAEGLMLKRRDSPYGVGRRRGDWWKWKIDPHSVDAVLVYAQAGHGRRASLYTDYTFALWYEGELVPVAKAYSGLTDEEIREVDAFVRRHTVERFGPVRRVEPRLVFELAFEAVQASSRHKAGVAVRFPRMARWRKDKAPADADSLDTLRSLIGT
jgi:DNA ligase-1